MHVLFGAMVSQSVREVCYKAAHRQIDPPIARPREDFVAMRAILAIFLWTACAVLGSIASAQTRDAGAAIIVLDGSGSMGGPLEGQKDVKFDMASRALLHLLPMAAPQSRTGLVTFGNRRKGDCGDADVVIAPASANLDQFTSVFSRIGPTGKGPLVLGVREAAKALPPDAPGTLIVIHDDADNCRQDVCAAASDLANITPKVTVHVISISLDTATSEKMSCLATATGGQLFEARDAASVESSLAEALRLARVMDPAARPADPVAAAPAAETAGPPSVRVSAGLSANSAAFSSPVEWRIIGPGTSQAVVKEATSPVLTTELSAGSYTVEARYGLASGRATVDVAEKGQTQARVSLEAANLKVSSTASKSSEPLANPVLSVSAIDKAASALKHIYVGHESQVDLVVPAGTYRVSASDGLAAKQQDITLSAGDTTPIDFALSTGLLELSAINREGGDTLDGTLFIVSVDDPDGPQGRREIARSIAPRPSFNLPAGTYYVTAKLGAAEVRERVALGTGDIVKRPIALNGSWTAFTATLDAGLFPKESPIVYRVMTKESTSREVARITSSKGNVPADIFLPQGSYRIEASAGHLNVKGAADTVVAAGPKVAITVGIPASELTVLPATGSAAPAGWDLRDGQGRIWQRSATSSSPKTLLLAPGRYLVRIDTGDLRSEKPLDLKPGERRSIPLTTN